MRSSLPIFTDLALCSSNLCPSQLEQRSIQREVYQASQRRTAPHRTAQSITGAIIRPLDDECSVQDKPDPGHARHELENQRLRCFSGTTRAETYLWSCALSRVVCEARGQRQMGVVLEEMIRSGYLGQNVTTLH
jgi:hypothetical protein